MSASPSLIGATTDGMPIVGQHSEDAAACTGVGCAPNVAYVVGSGGTPAPVPPWHYCPLPTPGEPSRIRVSVCGVRCDRNDPVGTRRGVSAPHLVTCPDCLAEIRDADRGANDHLRAAPSEILEVRRAG